MIHILRQASFAITLVAFALFDVTPMAIAHRCGGLPGLALDIQTVGRDALILGDAGSRFFVAKFRSELTEGDPLDVAFYSALGAPGSFADPRDGSVWFIAGANSIGFVNNGDLATLHVESVDTGGARIDSLVVRVNDILLTTEASRSFAAGILRLNRADRTLIERRPFEGNCRASAGALGVDDTAYFTFPVCSKVVRVDSRLNIEQIDIPPTFAPIQIAADARGTVGFLQEYPWVFGAIREDGGVDYYDGGGGAGVGIADLSTGADGSLWASDPQLSLYRFSNGELRKLGFQGEQVSGGDGNVWSANGVVACVWEEPIHEGDCNNDFAVEIYELVTCVRIALGDSALNSCIPCDSDRNGTVTIDELIYAVVSAQTSTEIPKVTE